MPDSWAKALAPTMALLGCTETPVIVVMSLLVGIYLLRNNACIGRKLYLAGPQDHRDLFEGGIAGTFTDAVDGALHLARAVMNCRDGIGDRKPEIVMAVDADNSFLDIGHMFHDITDESAEFIRNRVTDRVGNIDGGAPASMTALTTAQR